MSDYLLEVINRVSMGALYTLLVVIVIWLAFLSFRDKKQEPVLKKESCPLCGQEVGQ